MTEAEIHETIDSIYRKLITNNFQTNDIVEFNNTVLYLLNSTKFKHYFLAALFDKIEYSLNIFRNLDQDPKSLFRKLINLILKFDNVDITNALITYFCNDIDHLCVILEEQVKLKQDTFAAEHSFVCLYQYHPKYKFDQVQKFLNIIDKDTTYFAEFCIKHAFYDSLNKYINQTLLSDISHIVEVLLVSEISPIKYNELIISITTVSNEFTHLLVRDVDSFLKLTLTKYYTMNLIKHTFEFLQGHHPEKLDNFEDKLISTTSAGGLINYATTVKDSNKRKILLKLIGFKDKERLTEYINLYPEFQKLIPLL